MGPRLPWDIINLFVIKYCSPRTSLRMSMTCVRLYALWNELDRRWLRHDRRPAYDKSIPWNRLEEQLDTIVCFDLSEYTDFSYCNVCWLVALTDYLCITHCRTHYHTFDFLKNVCMWCYSKHKDSRMCPLSMSRCDDCEWFFEKGRFVDARETRVCSKCKIKT